MSRSFDGEIKDLARRLNPLSQAADVARLIDRFVGREWLATLVNDWRRHDGEQRMMLTGPAGIGKSAFVAWLTHFARANVVGLTMSQQRVAASCSPANVVRTLAFQIATRLPEYRSLLLDRLNQEDPEGERIAAMEPGPLFSFLLGELLKLIPDGGRTFDQFMLVVNSLDETLEGDRCPLAELFEWHAEFAAKMAVRAVDQPPAPRDRARAVARQAGAHRGASGEQRSRHSRLRGDVGSPSSTRRRRTTPQCCSA